jgi:hypothetical protein
MDEVSTVFRKGKQSCGQTSFYLQVSFLESFLKNRAFRHGLQFAELGKIFCPLRADGAVNLLR